MPNVIKNKNAKYLLVNILIKSLLHANNIKTI